MTPPLKARHAAAAASPRRGAHCRRRAATAHFKVLKRRHYCYIDKYYVMISPRPFGADVAKRHSRRYIRPSPLTMHAGVARADAIAALADIFCRPHRLHRSRVRLPELLAREFTLRCHASHTPEFKYLPRLPAARRQSPHERRRCWKSTDASCQPLKMRHCCLDDFRLLLRAC